MLLLGWIEVAEKFGRDGTRSRQATGCKKQTEEELRSGEEAVMDRANGEWRLPGTDGKDESRLRSGR